MSVNVINPPRTNFFWTQSLASATWVIVHNMGKYPSVTIQDSTKRQVFGQVQYNSLNQVTITFAAPQSGYVTLN